MGGSRGRADSVMLDQSHAALSVLRADLTRLCFVAQEPLSTVGAMLRRQRQRDSAEGTAHE